MRTLLDAGPLVALFDRRDEHHAWAARTLRGLAPPAFTCEAALAEAFHLLGKVPGGTRLLVELLRSGRVLAPLASDDHRSRVFGLLDTYADVPMNFADACLVCMLEAEAG